MGDMEGAGREQGGEMGELVFHLIASLADAGESIVLWGHGMSD